MLLPEGDCRLQADSLERQVICCTSFPGFPLAAFFFFFLSPPPFCSSFVPAFLFFSVYQWCCVSLVGLTGSRHSDRCVCSRQLCPKITSRHTEIHNNRWRIQRRAQSKWERGRGRERKTEKEQAERGQADVCCVTLPVTSKRESVAHCLPTSPIFSHKHTHTHTVYILTSAAPHVTDRKCDSVTSLTVWCHNVLRSNDPQKKKNPLISLTLTWFITSFCVCPALVDSWEKSIIFWSWKF